jgi:2-octaprenyl-6-methoxyphenol hydroxylase
MHKLGLHKVVIVGGGPVGSVLALALQQQQVPFTMLEARVKGASHGDTRALALSYGSRLILEKLGIWHAVAARATAINTIHISQRGGLGRSKLNAADHGLESLGYVLPYGALTQALDAVLNADNILYEAEATEIKPAQDTSSVTYIYANPSTHAYPNTHANPTQTLQSLLTVVADGGRSLGEIAGIEKETKEYGHDALVTKVCAELPHNNIAYERFTPSGPMALLPNGDAGFSLVWTGLQANIHALLALDDQTFLAQLHQEFGDRVGKFLSVEKRMSFPLKLSRLKPSVAPHLAVIGNAAQTMHPVAGQGFNVGMRDAWTLADLIVLAAQSELGSAAMLANYSQLRGRDTRGGILFTDLLVNVFNNDLLGLRAMRGTGLGLLELIKPAKNLLVSKMSFGK